MSSAPDAMRLQQLTQELSLDLIPPTQVAANEQMQRLISRCFATDTVTAPTPEMYAYATQASIGDAVFNEPCTAAFEQHVARIAGKVAALFVPSGTFSNQLAIRAHLTQPPHSVLLDARAHVYAHEAGGLAYHSQTLPITVKPASGSHMSLQDVKESIVLSEDIHGARTRVISLENTLNGTIYPQTSILEIAQFARENDVRMHLDGARLWHVVAKTGTSLRELCEPFDTVSLCFSKGLGAPIGSVVVGSNAFITRARWLRKTMGGGMRQTGYLAAAATFALNTNFPKLPAVHARAARLAAGLEALGARIEVPVETCMVFFSTAHLGVPPQLIVDRAAQLPDPILLFGSRLVVHVQTSEAAVDDLIALAAALVQEKRDEGWVSESLGAPNGSAKLGYAKGV